MTSVRKAFGLLCLLAVQVCAEIDGEDLEESRPSDRSAHAEAQAIANAGSSGGWSSAAAEAVANANAGSDASWPGGFGGGGGSAWADAAAEANANAGAGGGWSNAAAEAVAHANAGSGGGWPGGYGGGGGSSWADAAAEANANAGSGEGWPRGLISSGGGGSWANAAAEAAANANAGGGGGGGWPGGLMPSGGGFSWANAAAEAAANANAGGGGGGGWPGGLIPSGGGGSWANAAAEAAANANAGGGGGGGWPTGLIPSGGGGSWANAAADASANAGGGGYIPGGGGYIPGGGGYSPGGGGYSPGGGGYSPGENRCTQEGDMFFTTRGGCSMICACFSNGYGLYSKCAACGPCNVEPQPSPLPEPIPSPIPEIIPSPYPDGIIPGSGKSYAATQHEYSSSSESIIINDEITPQTQPSTSTANEEQPDNNTVKEVNHLDDEILTLLGDAPKEESPVGKDIHDDIAARLQDILKNGLQKETKTKITEEYPIPGNCQLFKAPVLNAEIKAAISEILQKKDASIAARQGQIGIALTALATVIDILVSEKSDLNQIILKHVSNACRLLCDSHCIDTKMRRNFLISTLNSKLKDTLKDSKRDKHLFGESLPDKLKATKANSKSSQDLRYNKPKPLAAKPIQNSTPTLNWKHPQPNPQNMNQQKGMLTAQRTAGYSSATATARRNEPARKPTSSRAPRTYAYRNRKRS